MSFWSDLGAAVGIGACSLEVILETPEAGWTERLEGTLLLSGGEVPQRLESLGIAVVEHWTTTVMVGKTPVTQHHYQAHDARQLAQDLTVQPGDRHTYPFSLEAPWGGMFSRHWFVGARAVIPSAVDRYGKADFRLLPAPVFRNTAALLSAAARMPVKRWDLLPGAGVRATLRPGAESMEVREVLDGLTLDLFLEEDHLRGTVQVNPQERTVQDVLASMVRLDRRTTPFRIPAGDPAAAEAVFEAALRPDLDALRHLPIPSTSPVDAEEQLPRPAAAPAPAPEQLPRPASGAPPDQRDGSAPG